MFQFQGACRPANRAEAAKMEVAAGLLAQAKESIERGDIEAALFDLDSSLCVMPNSLHAHFNRSQALLALGDYHEGFREFEYRLQLFGDPLPNSSIPMWRGEDIAGKRLLLCHEHGLGDGLMMMRYVPVLTGMGAKVTLLVPPPLLSIARESFSGVSDQYPEDESKYDYRCPIFSVMVCLGHGTEDIPKPPYLATSAGEPIPNSIGVCWSGNPKHTRDHQRSIDLLKFLSLLNTEREIYAVQPSDAGEIVSTKFEDFADVARLMSRLDHIVTVDTAAAHLAGAIGHPSVHVLVPYVSDWRWYRSKAWYPNTEVYRQDAPGDWASAFAKLNNNLSA